MVKHARFILAAIIGLGLFPRIGVPPVLCQPVSDSQIQSLTAFARLYGYVRFFHPSDEAALMDWDKLAVYGCSAVLDCKDRSGLRSVLNNIFAPIAPSVQIYETGHPPRIEGGKLSPQDTSHLRIVAWQHLGVGLSPQSVYKSTRLNRPLHPVEASVHAFGIIAAKLDATNLRGKRITFRASVKVDQESRGQLLLRVDRPGGRIGFFENMDDRPIQTNDWASYEVSGWVDSDAVNIACGFVIVGAGKVWVDDVHILSGEKEQGEEIALSNAGFEDDTPGAPPKDWGMDEPGYSAEVTAETASAGMHSLCLSSVPVQAVPPLFPEHPAFGENISCDLPGGLSCRIPLVVLSDSVGTLPRADTVAVQKLNADIAARVPGKLSGGDRSVRLADIVIAWNIFQHFYPYFDVTGVKWEEELPVALRQASLDTSATAFLSTLRKLVAHLHDGHGNVMLLEDMNAVFVPPLQWVWADEHLVVSALYDSSHRALSVGDIVLAIDGTPTEQALRNAESEISAATPQWAQYRALNRLLFGKKYSQVQLETENRSGVRSTVTFSRNLAGMQLYRLEQEHQRSIAGLADGIVYVNLCVASMQAVDSVMSELAGARGVICDLRGYPNNNHDLIPHLLQAPDTSMHWMGIPKVIYPDRKKPAGFIFSGWQLQPKSPHIGGRVVLLTDGRAISYAESYMSFIEHYKLAEIVGEPTAGTNGSINPFGLPGDYRVTWTGMLVRKHDGSRHHGVGIQPTLVVHRTVQGIREGRDEQLDAAIQLIDSQRR